MHSCHDRKARCTPLMTPDFSFFPPKKAKKHKDSKDFRADFPANICFVCFDWLPFAESSACFCYAGADWPARQFKIIF